MGRDRRAVSSISVSEEGPAGERADADQTWLEVGAGAPVIRSGRVLLRAWRVDDLEPFAALCADARVMEHYPALLTRAESDDLVRSVVERFVTSGFGWWAVEVPGVAPFIGYVGLLEPTFASRFTPCVEIGWRLAAPLLGTRVCDRGRTCHAGVRLHGRRAGRDCFLHGAGQQSLDRSHETAGHNPGRRFDHPRLPQGHRLQRHVLYRLSRAKWLQGAASDRSG